jgi:peptidoglycan hydrolase CwlO-like protein
MSRISNINSIQFVNPINEHQFIFVHYNYLDSLEERIDELKKEVNDLNNENKSLYRHFDYLLNKIVELDYKIDRSNDNIEYLRDTNPKREKTLGEMIDSVNQ